MMKMTMKVVMVVEVVMVMEVVVMWHMVMMMMVAVVVLHPHSEKYCLRGLLAEIQWGFESNWL